MGWKRQHFKINKSCFTLVLATLMICFMLSPMVYILSRQLDSNKGISKSHTEKNDESYSYIKYPSIFLIIPEKDNLKEVIRNTFSLEASFQLTNRSTFDKLLPTVATGVMVGTFLLNFRKTKKNKTVVEFSLGGHAPPFCL